MSDSGESRDYGTGEHDRDILVRPYRAEDSDDLRAVMESAVVNPITHEVLHGEIEDNLESLRQSLEPDSLSSYYVAEDSQGRAVGMMGLDIPGDVMRAFAKTDNPVEIINAYVSKSQRGKGTGKHLVHHLEAEAKAKGFSEVILNSGPRYRWSGWPFWKSVYGEPSGVAEKFYDGEWDAMVWRKEL